VLYRLVKWIIRLTLNSYFRRIVVTGRHHVPAKGPVIFVANHPSAFMDPMVIATTIGRSIHFLAAAEFFGKGIKAWMYQNYLNMIPVYRPSTLPNETQNNEAIFSKCFALLRNEGALLVFPEGNSVTEKRIRKLKTGVARMALGAKENSNKKAEVEIIPIGLNYSNPHRFQSDLYINIGKPISTNGFTVDKSEVVRLTNEVEERLKEAILHVPHEHLDSIVKKVELILKNRFQEATKIDANKRKEEFAFHQHVI
jgi:glycerol-3-phosphate O-acyltransferase/dihydroxyacetone phosphate acyltransferase